MLSAGPIFQARGAGKYTLPQKLMHLAWTVAVLVAIVTGLLLLRKAGVPFLERDPYVRSLAAWGMLTLLHDLAALLSVFLILRARVFRASCRRSAPTCAPWCRAGSRARSSARNTTWNGWNAVTEAVLLARAHRGHRARL